MLSCYLEQEKVINKLIMTNKELKKILENHIHWIRKDCVGWEDMRADLHGVNLRWANLRGANLREANLCEADLYGADLHEANLCGAHLCEANLYKANLYKANLSGANLYEVDLSETINVPSIPISCPDTGSFIGWKKDRTQQFIIKLLIPEDARRTSAASRKCRCDKAQVLAIENIDGSKSDEIKVFSEYDSNFSYCVGDIVTPKEPFCENRWQECSSGIHFFINRQEAVEY